MTPITKLRHVISELDLAEESLDEVLKHSLDCGPGASVACLSASLAVQEAAKIVRANLAALKDGRTAEEELVARGIPSDFAAMAVAKVKR
jgi:hypothetical protein